MSWVMGRVGEDVEAGVSRKEGNPPPSSSSSQLGFGIYCSYHNILIVCFSYLSSIVKIPALSSSDYCKTV